MSTRMNALQSLVRAGAIPERMRAYAVTGMPRSPSARGVLQAATAVQLSSREKRVSKNSHKALQIFDSLKDTIADTGAVGQVKSSWVIAKDEDEDSYACDAVVATANHTYAGSYSGVTGVHAEMAALANFVTNGSGRFNDIVEIRITKPTCPRCAYVLTSLGLAGNVRYPKGTDLSNRKGPGWTMPQALKNEPWYMEPIEGVIDQFEAAGYSRDEGFAFVVQALQSV